ncbi:MAG: hypothetical protein AAGB51_07540 [Planctomycetota bacterium]
MILPTIDDVFGVSKSRPLSYLEREHVDGDFSRALARDDHIVIYGASKQGKTSLWQKHLEDYDPVVVRCEPNTTKESIYASLLRQLDIQLQVGSTSERGGSIDIGSSVSAEARIPLFAKGTVSGKAGGHASRMNQMSFETVRFRLDEAQSVSEILLRRGFSQSVILENFHYLSESMQSDLAFDLKTFHELNVRFIIVGIWQESNFLLHFNPDLLDRLIEIPVEPWHEGEFDQIIQKGCEKLRFQISGAIRSYFASRACNNVGLLQDFIRKFCHLHGKQEGDDDTRLLYNWDHVHTAIQSKLDLQRGHLIKRLQSISTKSRPRSDSEDPLVLPYYLVRAICELPLDTLRRGVSKRQLRDYIRRVHHRADGISPRDSDITNLLNHLGQYQKPTKSPFLAYSSETRLLRVVDARQLFVLENSDRHKILAEIQHPLHEHVMDMEE